MEPICLNPKSLRLSGYQSNSWHFLLEAEKFMVYFLGHPAKLSDYDANVFLFWGIDLTINVCFVFAF